MVIIVDLYYIRTFGTKPCVFAKQNTLSSAHILYRLSEMFTYSGFRFCITYQKNAKFNH